MAFKFNPFTGNFDLFNDNTGSAAPTVTSTSGTFTASANTIYLIDTSGGTATVTLPSAVSGATIYLKDSSGDANTNNITVNTPGAETIDGAASLTMDSDFEQKTLVSDGTDWFIL